MSLIGKRVEKINFKADNNVFYELWTIKPHKIKDLSPLIQACYIEDGGIGRVGAIIITHYFIDGKDKVTKDIITDINEEKKLISFKVIEGDLTELYKEMQVTVHVETIGGDSFVVWTLEYEKLNDSVPDPDTFMESLLQLTKDMEAAQLSTSSVPF